MADIASNPMDASASYISATINNGGVIVGSPRGSGFLDSSVTFGLGYNGENTTHSARPNLGTINGIYSNALTGCAPCVS
tara:strand:+ start:955 stop:1191 length:237 start_codon:yes stop_codon:yes gene_type:complete